MKKIIVSIFIFVILLILFIMTRYYFVNTIDINGYAFTSNIIATNLSKGNVKPIDYIEVDVNDAIYKNSLSYYVGEEKKQPINLDYPIISKENEQILIMNNSSKYIDDTYYKSDSFENTYIVNGNLYSGINYDRIDRNKYIFLELNNKIFTALVPIKIMNNDIAVNSMIFFKENSLSYYSLENGRFVFHEITGIDKTEMIKIADSEISYEKLLENIGLGEFGKISDDLIVDDFDNKKDNDLEHNNENDNQKKDNEDKKNDIDNKNMLSVTFEPKETTVYSLKGRLNIIDETNQLIKGVTFEFKKSNKLFLRKVFYNSGDITVDGFEPNTTYQVTGYYNYVANGTEYRKIFYNDSIKTKGIENVGSIDFVYENIDVFTDSFKLYGVKLENFSNDDALLGLKKIAFEINGKEYPISNNILKNLKNLKTDVYDSPSILDSNKKYEITVLAYDIAGNKLTVNNNKISFMTPKESPYALIKTFSLGVDRVKVSLSFQNKDSINILNKKYYVYDSSFNVIIDGELGDDDVIEVSNLDTNNVYNFEIYGDYDLEDGNGILHERKLGSTAFITNSIDSLGYPTMNIEQKDLTDNYASFDLSLDVGSTNKQLKEIISSFTITIADTNSGEIISDYTTSSDETEDLKNALVINKKINSLSSNTQYDIRIVANVYLADNMYKISTTKNINTFKTLKKRAKVDIINKYINESTIDYDVRIHDLDGAILSEKVLLEVRNSFGALIYFQHLNINDDYKRITLNKLEQGGKYIFKYTAEEFNVGDNNSSFSSWETLLEESITTNAGITGAIQLESLLNQLLNINLFNLNNNSRWKFDGEGTYYYSIDSIEQILKLGSKNGRSIFSYYIPENDNQTVTISFSARYSDSSSYSKAYISNSDSADNAIELENLTDKFKDYKYTFVVKNGYFSFIIDEMVGENNLTSVEFKNLQVELGDVATNYKPYVAKGDLKATYLVNIDGRESSMSINEFYIRIFKENKLTDIKKYDIVDQNYIDNMVLTYDVNMNSNYRFTLSVKLNNRYYDLDSIDFTSDDEIHSIKTTADFFKINTNGKYIVVNDLDFRYQWKKDYSETFTFNGTIDFQGHKLFRNQKSSFNSLINTLGENGIIKNLDLHYELDNEEGVSYYSGLFSEIRGTISNIKITLDSANPKPNSQICLLGRYNYGLIENIVVHAKASFPVLHTSSMVVIYNYGTIRNGYAYGEAINATFINNSNSNKNVGVLAAISGNSGGNGSSSSISNFYSLIPINVTNKSVGDNEKKVGSIVGDAIKLTIKNVYSYTSGDNRLLNVDANLGMISGKALTSNVYYVSDDLYENSLYSQKISKLALRNLQFQDSVLNSSGSFDVANLIQYGYYPHIIWPNNMPIQEYISLPIADNADLVDIISVDKTTYINGKSRVTMTINNPNGEKVVNMGIYSINNVSIIDQVDHKGKSTLTIELSNPVTYTSTYYIRSITTTGAGGSFTINYRNGERIINIDMYRPIYNESDISNISKYPTENFILMNDIDLSLLPDPQIELFSGKLNGNNKVIKNIRITSNGKNSFIKKLNNGTIKDLYVENYVRENTDGEECLPYGVTCTGFIGFVSNSFVDNVHINNMKTTLHTKTGGLAGYVENSSITNSSVSNIELLQKSINVASNSSVGGLIGEISTTEIDNCFTQTVNFNLTNSLYTAGVGGLVGVVSSGKIHSAYSEGNIKVSSQIVGGIVGYNNGNIDNVYAKVNIISNQDYIGGIVGKIKSGNLNYVLSAGNLYSSNNIELSDDTRNFNRIVGNTSANQNSFSWSNQLINGFTSGKANGEILLSTSDLKNNIIYEKTIRLGSDFKYDDVSDGYLPKLVNSNTGELFANQKDIRLEEEKIKITNITVDKTVNRIEQLNVTLYNPLHYEITGLNIDDMTINEIKKIRNDGDYTDIILVATPVKYFDSYLISGIKYIENGKENIVNSQVKINAVFYKNIYSVDDWNNKIDKNSYENYAIVNDIDFTNNPITNVGIKVNRMIGLNDTKILKGINYSFNSVGDTGIIDTLVTQFENITVDNLHIESRSWSNNFGFIKFLNGVIKNVKILNSEISNSRALYVGFIGKSSSPDFRNIYMDNVHVTGRGHVGGFIGSSPEIEDGSYVEIRNITVDGATSSYVGGFCGNCYTAQNSKWFHFKAYNVTVEGQGNCFGGIFGSGDADFVDVEKVRIVSTGNTIGGVSGHGTHAMNVKVKDVKINGNGSNIGGVIGIGYNYENIYADDIKIETSENSTCVGGIIGNVGNNLFSSGIRNSKITSSGDKVAGISGCGSQLYLDRIFVENTSIVGRNKVSGVLASTESSSSHINHFTVNASVSATGNYAGGIMGYISNRNGNNSANRIIVENGLVLSSNVSANQYAGGSFGYVESELDQRYFSNIFVSANVESIKNVNYPITGAVIGNGDNYANYDIISLHGINGLRVYEDSKITINGEEKQLKDFDTELSRNLLVSRNDIEKIKTYNNISINTDYFDFSMLQDGMYPKLKDDIFTNVSFNDIYPNFIAFDATISRMSLMASRSFIPLPQVTVYSSDVDKINIEFSNITDNTFFEIGNQKYQISKKTYTFMYDYKTDFIITLSNGVSTKMIQINHNEIQNKVYVDDNYYYIIDDGSIETNDLLIKSMGSFNKNVIASFMSKYTEKIDKKISNALHIYNGKVLLDDKYVYNLDKHTSEKVNIENFTLVDTKPLYSFNYANSNIKTFYNYSLVDNVDIPKQLFVKNNIIEIIDSSLNNKKNNITIDEYNGKSSIIYLGKDKKIYNLKNDIKYPQKFVNSNIRAISSNVTNNSSLIMVLYENENYVVFDYKKGEIIEEYKSFKPNIFSYIKSYISGEYDKGIKSDRSYVEANKLITKLNENSPEKVLYNGKKNNSSFYQTLYNPVTTKYDVYELPLKDNDNSSLINSLNALSVNGKINNNQVLSAFYNNNSQIISYYLFVVIVIILGLIFISAGILKYFAIGKKIY